MKFMSKSDFHRLENRFELIVTPEIMGLETLAAEMSDDDVSWFDVLLGAAADKNISVILRSLVNVTETHGPKTACDLAAFLHDYVRLRNAGRNDDPFQLHMMNTNTPAN